MNLNDQAYEWWKSTGGVLVDADAVFGGAVLFAPSANSGGSLRPLLVGAASLPAQVLGSTDFNELATSLRYQDGYAEEVAAGYRHAIETFEAVEDIHHCAGQTTAGEIDLKIRKIALPVRTTKGGLLIMSYSEKISVH